MRQEEILETLRAHGPMTVTQILGKLGVKNTHPLHTNCNSTLRQMRKWGEVEVVGTEGAGRHTALVWAVVE